jgi:predicted deacylase
MQVHTVGDGTPEVAVVGGVHGDEPCGVRAIERFLDSDHVADVQRPVKLVVANELAVKRGVRYVDTDLNRTLPGDPEGDAHEERLAADLFAEVEGCTALGIHSTVSYGGPFANVAYLDERERRVVSHLPVDAVVDFTVVADGRSVELPGFVDIEAGYQGSADAVDNAYDCILAFLRTTGVLPGDPPTPDPPAYDVVEPMHKDPGREYRFRGRNFERVAPGETFATVDGEPLVAEEEFWPVLMSSDGHDTLLGYRADHRGPLSTVALAEAEGDASGDTPVGVDADGG